MIYKFRLDDINSESIIGNVFIHNSHSFKIIDITKTWGEPPVLLGYINARNEQGKIVSFLIKCRKSFVDEKWDVIIDEKP